LKEFPITEKVLAEEFNLLSSDLSTVQSQQKIVSMSQAYADCLQFDGETMSVNIEKARQAYNSRLDKSGIKGERF